MKNRSTTGVKPGKRADQPRGRTNLPGQNPKADDSPEHDLYHDENRRNMYNSEPHAPGENRKSDDSPDPDVHHDENRQNMFDPEVAEALKGSRKKKQG